MTQPAQPRLNFAQQVQSAQRQRQTQVTLYLAGCLILGAGLVTMALRRHRWAAYTAMGVGVGLVVTAGCCRRYWQPIHNLRQDSDRRAEEGRRDLPQFWASEISRVHQMVTELGPANPLVAEEIERLVGLYHQPAWAPGENSPTWRDLGGLIARLYHVPEARERGFKAWVQLNAYPEHPDESMWHRRVTGLRMRCGLGGAGEPTTIYDMRHLVELGLRQTVVPQSQIWNSLITLALLVEENGPAEVAEQADALFTRLMAAEQPVAELILVDQMLQQLATYDGPLFERQAGRLAIRLEQQFGDKARYQLLEACHQQLQELGLAIWQRLCERAVQHCKEHNVYQAEWQALHRYPDAWWQAHPGITLFTINHLCDLWWRDHRYFLTDDSCHGAWCIVELSRRLPREELPAHLHHVIQRWAETSPWGDQAACYRNTRRATDLLRALDSFGDPEGLRPLFARAILEALEPAMSIGIRPEGEQRAMVELLDYLRHDCDSNALEPIRQFFTATER